MFPTWIRLISTHYNKSLAQLVRVSTLKWLDMGRGRVRVLVEAVYYIVLKVIIFQKKN